MTKIFVQFDGTGEQKVISVFGSAQDATAYPNQGAIDSSDDRYRAFYESFPEFMRSGLTPDD